MGSLVVGLDYSREICLCKNSARQERENSHAEPVRRGKSVHTKKRPACVSVRNALICTFYFVFWIFLSFLLGSTLPSVSTASETIKVLCLGDSLTEGYGVLPEEAYPSLLEKSLHAKGHKNVEVINAGIAGSTTASAWSRLNWQLRANPKILILALGANDGLRGLSLEEVHSNLERAIVLAQERGVTVLLAGMQLPPNYGPKYTEKFRLVYANLAQKHHTALIPFLLDGVAGEKKLNQADGIHPNAAGHRLIAKTVLLHLEPLL